MKRTVKSLRMRIVIEVADTQMNALVSGIFDLHGGIRILLESVLAPPMGSAAYFVASG